MNYKLFFSKSFCVLLLLPIFSSGQEAGLSHHHMNNRLDSLLYISNDTSSYIKELENLPDSNLMESQLFTAAKVFLGRKDFPKFRYFTKLNMNKGQLASAYIWAAGVLLSKKEKDSLYSWEYDSRKIFFRITPRELYDEINEMNFVDAKLREYHSKNLISWKTVQLNDSLNFNTLKNIISKYGMITERRYGMLFHKFFYIIIHCCHSKYENYEFMRKLLLAEVMKGNIRPDSYTYFVDRWGILSSGKQPYGTISKPTDLKELANIDSRRAQIGDCSLINWYKIKKKIKQPIRNNEKSK